MHTFKASANINHIQPHHIKPSIRCLHKDSVCLVDVQRTSIEIRTTIKPK